jgi:glycosidase
MSALRSIFCGLAVVALAQVAWGQSGPRVDSVEPPSWWPNHSLNPVRLLLRGTNLAGASVTSEDVVLRPGLARVSPSGTSLLVDVQIEPGAAPGPRVLRIIGSGGKVDEVAFELLQPLTRSGRFQGVDRDDVIYLIMPDRFANGDLSNDRPYPTPDLTDRTQARFYHGGDLQGIIDRLPYLKDLGVTALWLNPWYDNVNQLNRIERYTTDNRLSAEGDPITDYHGYGTVDFYAVEEHFGTLAKLKELVDTAHELGLKVIQDQVANHTGPYHAWVEDPPTPTWFNGTVANHLENTWQTWTLPDPNASPALQRATLEGWFINILPDLNQNDEDCARYLMQNSLWWVGMTGIDAIRQDTLPYVPRTFWAAWTTALKREYPQLNVIGEMFDGDPAKVSFFQAGRTRFDGIDSGIELLFDFPLYYPIRRVFAEGQSLKQLPEALAKDQLYPEASQLVVFLGLHDVGRFINEQGATPEGLKLAYTFLFTTRGIPLIYYGDEIAMPGGGDPDNRRDFPGGWLSDARNAFTAVGRTESESDVFNHLKKLGALRRSSEALRRGRLLHLAVEENAYVFARMSPQQRLVIALNTADGPQPVTVSVAPLGPVAGARLEPRFGGAVTQTIDGPELTLQLPPRSGLVWEWAE